jgi:hypothetical protein
VARYDRIAGLGKLAVEDVEVGAADAAGTNPDQDLSGARRRDRALLETEQRTGPIDDHRAQGQ